MFSLCNQEQGRLLSLTDWEKIFTKYISDKRLVSVKLNKENKPTKKQDKKTRLDISLKIYKLQTQEKMLNI